MREKSGKMRAQEDLFSLTNLLKWAFIFPLFSRISPDALHPGWRLKAAGPEAQRRQAWLPLYLQVTAGTTLSHPVRRHPLMQVQGTQYPGGVWGETPA